MGVARSAGWVCALCASVALAGPRTLTVAAGDCRNPELITATQTFTGAVAEQAGTDMLTSEDVLERFRPVPTLSSEELSRQLEAAQAQFYSGSNDKALDGLRQSIAAIQRLSPRADPWKLMSRALMLQAVVYKSAGKRVEALEAQKRVLRIDPRFTLDVDYYTPATIQAFEALRKEVQKAKKARLTITSAPTGADVFLDGARVGTTPFAAELPTGDYRLSLASGDKLSFTRELKLARDEAVQVDLAFEGALSPQAPLCVSTEPAQLIDTALKLGALAGAENVAVLRLEARNNEPGWVTAVLVEVNKGTRVRDGGIRFVGARRGQALRELAGFVLTGTPMASVTTAAAVAADAPRAVTQAPPSVEEERGGRGVGLRVVSIALIGAGAIAAASAVGIYVGGGEDRAALARLVDDQGKPRRPGDAEEVKGVQARIDRNATTGLALGVAGGAAVAIGVAVFFLFPPSDGAPTFSVVPGRDGVWVGTAFSF